LAWWLTATLSFDDWVKSIGDAILITVPGSEFTYRVTFTDIVDPREIWVLQPATGALSP
jgi:sortase (surface protein transpeptidase)